MTEFHTSTRNLTTVDNDYYDRNTQLSPFVHFNAVNCEETLNTIPSIAMLDRQRYLAIFY